MEDILNSPEIVALNKEFEQKTPLKIESFDNEECIGVGGFGKVYKVKNLIDNKHYAMKILNVSQLLRQQMVSQVHNEIMILAKCSHENVIKIYAVFQNDNDFCIILELSEGKNLFKLLKEQQKLSNKEVMSITLQITKALDYLHTQTPPIIHRDLKPENVLYH